MTRKSPNQRLAALLAETGWTAATLARAVNALGRAQGRELHYTRASVGHWLRGSRPPAPVPDLVAEALGRRLGHPLTAEETGLTALPPHQAALPPVPETAPDPLQHLLLLTRSDTDPTRRITLHQPPYIPARGPVPHWRPQAPSLPPASRRGRPATPADAVTLKAALRATAYTAVAHGGAHARTALAAYLADDAGPLLTRPATRPVRQELLLHTAQLTCLLGAMSDDSGHHHLAQRYYTTALGLARQAGHRPTFAITLRSLSLQALRLGHSRHAHELAGAAVEAAGKNADPAVLAYVLIQHARTTAHQRSRRQALALMKQAQRHHDRAVPGTPDPFTSYSRAGLDYQRAEVFSALGRPAEALDALDSSVRHRSPEGRAPGALTHHRAAELHARLGHLDAACTHWQHFLTLYPHLHSTRADQALTVLCQTLRPHSRHHEARAVLEHAQALLPGPA
ncbi:hypothetical protein [Streptomyces peucetius]|uniref:tetratricopeptide repeat protein n=1 Tax=Streptomyces peucetius TaxID=1950 RepID=UPI00067C8B02|nr:hypothetical protein [Streptomyces peucetius]